METEPDAFGSCFPAAEDSRRSASRLVIVSRFPLITLLQFLCIASGYITQPDELMENNRVGKIFFFLFFFLDNLTLFEFCPSPAQGRFLLP